MKIPCTSCGQRLEIPEELAGQTIECPACKASLSVPTLEASPPEPPQVQTTKEMKNCPHCDRVLMASVLSQCSWCGGVLKENELQKSREEILQRWEKDKQDLEYQQRIEKHGKDVRKAFERNIGRRL